MKITNNSTRDLGIGAEVVVPAGGSIEIANDRFTALKASPVVKAWLVDGLLVEDGAAEEPQGEGAGDRAAIVAGIIRGLDAETGFTKGGKPEVDAINAAMVEDAEPVTAAERDAIWAAMGEGA